jgi:hypothetical protein
MSERVAGEPTAVNPALPLFYKRVEVVDEAKLANSSLKEQIGYDFARNANFVPLIAPELFSAASTYPIVFVTEPVSSILAVLGLREASNLFVTADGKKWDATYIPAYVRRYPFVFFRHDNDDLTLCIDAAANALEPGGNRPLFKDGQRTPVVENALQFCVEFQRGHLATEAFIEGVDRAGSADPLPGNLDPRVGGKAERDRLQSHRRGSLRQAAGRHRAGLVQARLAGIGQRASRFRGVLGTARQAIERLKAKMAE